MIFMDIDWADSNIETITIEYDHTELQIWNDALQRRLIVDCWGVAGITNLCIWDDTIISTVEVYSVVEEKSDFVRNLYTAYNKELDYGGRSLKNGLKELRIELVNNIAFSIYCQKIETRLAQS